MLSNHIYNPFLHSNLLTHPKISLLNNHNQDYLHILNFSYNQHNQKILDLIIKNEDEIYNNNIENDNDNLLVTFKNQENEYIKTINMLQNRVIEKDKEIQMIKEEFKNILND